MEELDTIWKDGAHSNQWELLAKHKRPQKFSGFHGYFLVMWPIKK